MGPQALWGGLVLSCRNERYIVLQGETLHSVQGDIAFECHSESA